MYPKIQQNRSSWMFFILLEYCYGKPRVTKYWLYKICQMATLYYRQSGCGNVVYWDAGRALSVLKYGLTHKLRLNYTRHIQPVTNCIQVTQRPDLAKFTNTWLRMRNSQMTSVLPETLMAPCIRSYQQALTVKHNTFQHGSINELQPFNGLFSKDNLGKLVPER